MHEYSLVRGMLRQIHEISQQQQAKQVHRVWVTIGEFSGVEPELLRLAFEELSALDGLGVPTLEMEIIPLEAFCLQCEQRFYIEDFRFVCPKCGESKLRIIGGEELVLDRIELEQEIT